MDAYLGIDIGTSGCKAVVFDGEGRQLAEARREYELISPRPGWAELDPAEVLEKCLAVIAEAAGASGAEVRSIATSSQGEAFTAVDADGRPLCNALVSSDIRAAGLAADFAERFGAEKLYRITGHTAHPMFSLPKLLWVRENAGQIWRSAERFLCFEDLLAARLGVEPAMGYPLAGRTMLFDVTAHRWSGEILEAIGLEESRLARALPSGSVSGALGRSVASELGLGEGVRLVCGGHDQPCGALGAGVTEPGVAMYATGSVECITPAFREPVFTEELRRNNLCTYDHAAAGMYTTVAFSLTGGNLLKWFRDQFGGVEAARAEATGGNAYALLLETAGDEPSPLLALPYLTPTGTPHFDPHATGAILGLELTSTRGQVLRALLEGVALEMRLNLEILENSGFAVHRLRAIGGGAKSPRWTQLKADVIGKSVEVLNITEAGCLGAALLGCAACTGEEVASLAGRWTRVVGEAEPRDEYANWYAQRFETYKGLYPALKNFCPRA